MTSSKRKYRSRNGRKFIFSDKDIAFIRNNHSSLTNPQLAQALQLSLTIVRAECYRLGLYRMRLEYWTPGQVAFLKKNYQTIGDMELAEIFNKKFPKNKKWTHKHINKKRDYLNLHRTEKQLQNIKQRNVDSGRFAMCPVKRWLTTGQAKEGTIRYWKNKICGNIKYVPRIKINGKWIFWARHTWEKHHGRIPKRMNIVFKDNNPMHRRLSNLIMISKSKLAKRNSQISSVGLSDRYIASMIARQGACGKRDPELIDAVMKNTMLINAKRQQLLLERRLNNYA